MQKDRIKEIDRNAKRQNNRYRQKGKIINKYAKSQIYR